jgi:hypothetical protein
VKAYRFFAYFIAALVVVQAAAIAFAVFGESNYIMNDGGEITKAVVDAEDTDLFTGVLGFPIHGINGMMFIPLVTIIFLITSFFAKVPEGVKYAGIVFVMVALQIVLGIAGGSQPYLGMLHGINALGIFYMALKAARLVGTEPATTSAPTTV